MTASGSSAPRPKSLDHVALWVADRDALSDLLCGALGMHVVERTDDFTLVGVDAKLGKLTLFAAEGPREPDALERVVLRVEDVDAVVEALPSGVAVERDGDEARFAGPEGLGIGLVATADGQRGYDLDHVVLRVPDPEAAAEGFADLGFERRDGALWVEDRCVRFVRGDAGGAERPLLNHLALLVDSADEHVEAARAKGVEVEQMKDAANTYAGFVRGPHGIRVEFVEHKPSFSLV